MTVRKNFRSLKRYGRHHSADAIGRDGAIAGLIQKQR
jgi:hypothetical protein